MTEPDPANVEEWGRDMWAIFTRLARQPRTEGISPDRHLELLHEEAEVLDLFRRYHYLYDGRDIDGVLDEIFDDDCVVVNPRGTYVGRDAIRANYEYVWTLWRGIMHFGTNPLVRLNPTLDEGWLTAFYYSVILPNDDNFQAAGGTYVDRVRKRNGRWKIFEQRITYNFAHQMTPPLRRRPAPPPTPTNPRRSGQLIEREFVL